MMQRAIDKARAANLSVGFDVQDAESLTYSSGSFDAVVSRHVLWTLADPARAIREWARVLKPAGLVITDIPRLGSHSGKHHYGEEMGQKLPLGNGAEPEEIVAIFEKAGLANVSLKLLEKQSEEHREHRKTMLIWATKR